ncbi:PLP-dependent aminotransferase family protein [Paenibacillus tepidiphilus]|uniref:aminotransferase-like domain-containing protein n=1 Tax=Paenibacillus tepidiphilus TaxID=2608683 RepID=UPI001EF0E094|nr:PLP-dependent aminotransferase family protein [Paenibacillus tepidiphilus]
MNFTLAFDQYLAVYRRKYLALYHALRAAILDGTLPGGTRLPSTRKLAEYYQVSRGSVSQVYDMLLADGYIQAEIGRGTFVSPHSFFPAAGAGEEAKLEEAGASGGGRWNTPAEEAGASGDIGGKTGPEGASVPGGSGRRTAQQAGTSHGSAGYPVTHGWSTAQQGARMSLASGGYPETPGRSTAQQGAGTSPGSGGYPVTPGRSTAQQGAGTSPGSGGYPETPGPSGAAPAAIRLSAWGERLMQRQAPLREAAAEDRISFRGAGMPMEHFPYAEWRSALHYAAGKGGGLLASGSPAQGDPGLRQAIAAHLRITRGIRAEAGQIAVFSGSMQGIVLLTQLLLDAGSPAVVEDPGFHGIRRAVESAGGRLLAGKVDESGLQPEEWEAGLLFVTPSRQYPTGAVLPLERRRQLLEWAGRQGAVIVEDDYDSEFRWAGRPIEPLKALDREERVVYVGSFTNSMFAGLRLGYAVLPPALVAPVTAAKALYEPQPAGALEQRALARFMATGGYSRHLRRLTRLYGERARLLRSLLTERLGGLFEPLPGDAGLHIYARWKRSAAEFAAFSAAAAARGADFRDAALYRMSPGEDAVCFSFAHLPPEALQEGINRLLAAWNDVQNRT